jgi:hypothetical protein
MIILGKYVFKACECGCQKTLPIYLEPGYLECVSQVDDHWRTDLDKSYNPRYVPACIGPTTFGRISILTWPADERADDPVAEYWNERHVTGIFRSEVNK